MKKQAVRWFFAFKFFRPRICDDRYNMPYTHSSASAATSVDILQNAQQDQRFIVVEFLKEKNCLKRKTNNDQKNDRRSFSVPSLENREPLQYTFEAVAVVVTIVALFVCFC